MEAIDYLSGAFVTEAAELENVGRKANEARETLEDFADEGAWPYELVQGEARKARKPPEAQISHSTSAMNLFAMGIACGRVQSSTLAPYVARLTGKKGEKAQAKFDYQLTCFLTAIADEKVGPDDDKWHSYSQTYGDDDPFTLLWILEMCRDLRGDVLPELHKMARRRYSDLIGFAVDRVNAVFKENAKPWNEAFKWKEESNRPKHNEPLEHSFPTLHVVQLFDHLRAAKKADDPALKALLEKLPRTDYLERYLHDRLHLHLSYSKIRDSSYDAAELAYTMEALLLLDEDSIDAATVEQCRRVLLDTQQANSYWRPLRPFLATPQGMVLLPLSVETANSLVRSFEILARRERSRADRSGDAALFQRYTEWLFGRIVRGEDKEGKNFAGWRSEHADDRGKIHTWETSQVLIYLLQYEAFLQTHRAEKALRCMRLKITEPPDVRNQVAPETPYERWKTDSEPVPPRNPVPLGDDEADSPQDREPLRAVDAALYPESTDRAQSSASDDASPGLAVYAKIGVDFLKPRSGKPAEPNAPYSMLLYGPQGTGKTELASSVARTLRWPLITVSPSDFMVSGDTLLEARAKQLFDVLEAQFDAVILLDEIDRLILDRNSRRYEKQGDSFQLMTPGMLTKFHNLRDAKRSVFIVSTNYAEHIDPAIKREGRIDQQYLVLPPDREQRARILRRQLRAAKLPVGRMPSKTALIGGVPKAALFVFGELKKLAEKTVTAIMRGETLDVVTLLNKFAGKQTPTIRLAAYESRFTRISEKSSTDDIEHRFDQQPHDEFMMLMYLVVESRDPDEEEMEVWRSVLGKSHADRVAAIIEHIQSDDVRRVLIGADKKFWDPKDV